MSAPDDSTNTTNNKRVVVVEMAAETVIARECVIARSSEALLELVQVVDGESTSNVQDASFVINAYNEMTSRLDDRVVTQELDMKTKEHLYICFKHFFDNLRGKDIERLSISIHRQSSTVHKEACIKLAHKFTGQINVKELLFEGVDVPFSELLHVFQSNVVTLHIKTDLLDLPTVESALFKNSRNFWLYLSNEDYDDNEKFRLQQISHARSFNLVFSDFGENELSTFVQLLSINCEFVNGNIQVILHRGFSVTFFETCLEGLGDVNTCRSATTVTFYVPNITISVSSTEGTMGTIENFTIEINSTSFGNDPEEGTKGEDVSKETEHDAFVADAEKTEKIKSADLKETSHMVRRRTKRISPEEPIEEVKKKKSENRAGTVPDEKAQE